MMPEEILYTALALAATGILWVALMAFFTWSVDGPPAWVERIWDAISDFIDRLWSMRSKAARKALKHERTMLSMEASYEARVASHRDHRRGLRSDRRAELARWQDRYEYTLNQIKGGGLYIIKPPEAREYTLGEAKLIDALKAENQLFNTQTAYFRKMEAEIARMGNYSPGGHLGRR